MTLFGDVRVDAEILSAATDDSAVIRSLLDARLLAEPFLESADLGGPTADDLRMFIGYVDAALLRRKNFVTVLKTDADFADFSRRVASQLHDAVSETFQALENSGQNVKGERQNFAALWMRAPAQPAGFVNWVITNVLAKREQRARFEALLQKETPRRAALGRWRAPGAQAARTRSNPRRRRPAPGPRPPASARAGSGAREKDRQTGCRSWVHQARWLAADSELARRWRSESRAAFEAAIDAGLIAVDFLRKGAYLMAREAGRPGR